MDNTMQPHPFVALMRRYCIDYTNCHDLSVCDSIMADDYTLKMGPHVLRGRDGAYKPAAEQQFRQFPTLGLVVHEIVTNGDRLAMRFSEHGASVHHERHLACWPGVALYKWDGAVLVENWVEQDYLARREQLVSGIPRPLEPAALDPWFVQPEDASSPVEQNVSSWLTDGGFAGWAKTTETGSSRPRVDVEQITIDDIFSAGSRAAFHVTGRGTYIGGLEGLDPRRGDNIDVYAAGIVTVAPSGRVEAAIVLDGLGIWKALA